LESLQQGKARSLKGRSNVEYWEKTYGKIGRENVCGVCMGKENLEKGPGSGGRGDHVQRGGRGGEAPGGGRGGISKRDRSISRNRMTTSIQKRKSGADVEREREKSAKNKRTDTMLGQGTLYKRKRDTTFVGKKHWRGSAKSKRGPPGVKNSGGQKVRGFQGRGGGARGGFGTI